ncbi:MAG: HAMP domain-containing histidine kinase [Ignavibacteria bacterium]|nr:HAMP domain-containing histidine kinase [Ignavibacteria bacterium]MCU7512513.1 HAMP domain-containing histidine kinase [Ignavibacteria bacterium]MCU7524578.1 HAMP domain-containing histidine kinase [Ignavibacteria bacterium]HEX2960348.1 HAMP domain-containing sensor histidine kinase [Ignavibacteriales bacterium]
MLKVYSALHEYIMMMHNEIQDNKLQILGKLAASLAHEIRNPLSAIKLNLDFVSMSDISPEVKESITACMEAAKRIQAIVETTLDFSRSTLSDCFPQSLNEVVTLAVEIMSARAKILNIEVAAELETDLPKIYFNKNKILQVVLNLMTNAFEAIEKNGKVSLKTYRETMDGNNFVTLEVQDTGKGISEENKEMIFNDFYTNKKEGTGLGLSVCRSILDEFGATISFTSSLGEGSRFYVRFNPNINGVIE